MNNVTVDEADILWCALGRCTFVYIDVVCVCVCVSFGCKGGVHAFVVVVVVSIHTYTSECVVCVL
jgi:hypothetical protein